MKCDECGQERPLTYRASKLGKRSVCASCIRANHSGTLDGAGSDDPLSTAREIMKQQARAAGQPITERWHNHPSLDICVPGRCPAGTTGWGGRDLVIDHFCSTASLAKRKD